MYQAAERELQTTWIWICRQTLDPDVQTHRHKHKQMIDAHHEVKTSELTGLSANKYGVIQKQNELHSQFLVSQDPRQ